MTSDVKAQTALMALKMIVEIAKGGNNISTFYAIERCAKKAVNDLETSNG